MLAHLTNFVILLSDIANAFSIFFFANKLLKMLHSHTKEFQAIFWCKFKT